MQTNIEVISNIVRKIVVKAPAERVDQAVEQRLKETGHKFRLDGFRPGKIPSHVLRQRFGKAIRYEVIENLIETTYQDMLVQEKIQPAGPPNVNILQDKAGEPFEYEMLLEVYPKIQLNSLAVAEIQKFKVDILQKDIDEMIQRLRRQRAKWNTVDRPARKGDRLVVSFEGRQHGELFDGGSAKEVYLELGLGMTIPGFEDGFIGQKAGDSFDLNLTFPADYLVTTLAGNPAEFKCTLHKVEMPELAPIDDAFAKALGIEEGGIDQLRHKVLEEMHKEVDQTVKNHIKNQVLEQLVALNTVELPKALLEQELKNLHEQERQYIANTAKQTGKNPSLQPRKAVSELAQRRVHLGLLFHEIIRQNDIKPSETTINKLIENIAAGHGADPEMVGKIYRENKRLYQQLEEKAIEDQIVDLLISQAKYIEKEIPYSEFKGLKPIIEDEE